MLTALDASPDALDDREKSFVANIREHGWLRTNIYAEADEPGFSYTTGLWVNAKIPEIVVFSLKGEFAHDICWNLFNDARSGIMPAIGTRTSEVFSNKPAYFFVVDKKHYRDCFGWNRWFYAGDDFPCLQLVWPDREGVLPWEKGFDETFRDDQPDLTEYGWAASIVS